MTLRLRCIRCGDWADMSIVALDPGVCAPCGRKYQRWFLRGVSYRKRRALWARHRRNVAGHPTFRALTAALEALESAPHGRLVTEPGHG